MAIAVLGGAGFLGSHVAEAFLNDGESVTVIDGLLPQTGGAAGNVPKGVTFVSSAVEVTPDLANLLGKQELIVDCMGWTRHHEAVANPWLDLDRNGKSHLHVLRELAQSAHRPRFILLSSRGQFGSGQGRELDDDAPQTPEDIQGAHKALAESYFRAFGRSHGFSTISLRVGNCFGARQVTEGKDIGLIGGMIREALQTGTITVFAPARTRALAYAPDLGKAIVQLSKTAPTGGLLGINYPGREVTVGELATEIAGLTGAKIVEKEMPAAVRAVEMSGGRFFSNRLEEQRATSLKDALALTVSYFREKNG